mmetsp:Transcript_508/g.1236  ORF Transcript_508/g.1236 Transcript_508/m.1236 type:complete len:221 (+) Transcript_508:291-953(+)
MLHGAGLRDGPERRVAQKCRHQKGHIVAPLERDGLGVAKELRGPVLVSDDVLLQDVVDGLCQNVSHCEPKAGAQHENFGRGGPGREPDACDDLAHHGCHLDPAIPAVQPNMVDADVLDELDPREVPPHDRREDMGSKPHPARAPVRDLLVDVEGVAEGAKRVRVVQQMLSISSVRKVHEKQVRPHGDQPCHAEAHDDEEHCQHIPQGPGGRCHGASRRRA